MGSTPIKNGQLGRNIFVETFAYFRLGVIELIKINKIVIISFIVILVVIFVAAEAAKSLAPTDKQGGIWGMLYMAVSGTVIIAGTCLYFASTLLQKYRKSNVRKSAVFLCFFWLVLVQQVLPPLAGRPAGVLGDLLFNFLTYQDRLPSPAFMFIMDNGIYLLVQYIIASIIFSLIVTPLTFLPLLILENSKNIIRQNWNIVKKCYASISLLWFFYSFLSKSFTPVLIYKVLFKIVSRMPAFFSDSTVIGFISIGALSVVFSIILAAVLTAAYLRETGEYDFAHKPTFTPLIKQKT